MTNFKLFLAILTFLGLSLSAKAQVYNEDDKEGLRIFLRQPSNTAGQINAERLGITDTSNWHISEAWVDAMVTAGGIVWDTASPKRLIKFDWYNKSFAGTLDASKWGKLMFLKFDYNALTALDVSKNAELTGLSCNNNPLGALDVSKNVELTSLDCSSNSLGALDVNANTALTLLKCNNNGLTSLDLSNNISLTHLYSYNNRLQLSDLYAASEKVTNQNIKDLGTQNLLPMATNVGQVLFSDQAIFGGIYTKYEVSKNGSPASDYDTLNGTITFNDMGKFTVTMTNTAIVSNSNFPAKVVVDINISYTKISGKILPQISSGYVELYSVKNNSQYTNKMAPVDNNGNYLFTDVENGVLLIKYIFVSLQILNHHETNSIFYRNFRNSRTFLCTANSFERGCFCAK